MEDYEWSRHPIVATIYENIELVCTGIMYDRRRSLHDIARQIGISVYLDQYLRDVQGLSWMGPQNIDQKSKEQA